MYHINTDNSTPKFYLSKGQLYRWRVMEDDMGEMEDDMRLMEDNIWVVDKAAILRKSNSEASDILETPLRD